MTNVYKVHCVDARLVDACARLMPQLSLSVAVPGEEELQRIVSSPTTALFCADEDGAVAGMLSLAWYDVPSGRHAWIEDVVVETDFRGRGIGRLLVEAALEYAVQIGADKVSLTSHASRTAAHMLYRAEGFETYETMLFRRKLR